MNSSPECHEIPDCPNLFIDAFRGHYLSSKSKDAENVFILTHYHGDHYGSLPKDGRYQGPAVIHCTPVTAELLRRVHGVPSHLVCEHPYGDTWDLVVGKNGAQHESSSCSTASITFYDANHCPGAAMVLIQARTERDLGRINTPAGVRYHLHTGDFRYHPRMQWYPLLRHAVQNRTLDCLFLDSTFAHPRHSFESQSVAIDSIASQVQDLLSLTPLQPDPDQKEPPSESFTSQQSSSPPPPPPSSSTTLVLLSCYSIGKERVLWEVSSRTGQPVYVSETKLKKLECLAVDADADGSDKDALWELAEETSVAASSPGDPMRSPHNLIVKRCTCDPDRSDVHVVPMGTAGELWPFFQPNYWGCHEYASKLPRRYRRVVAFIPTGWAQASKWNREHAVTRQQCKGVEVEIRLVAYSEHSSFAELKDFVRFCRPRKVLPTVYADEKDRRRIEGLFPVDAGRAKLHFFRPLQRSGAPASVWSNPLETASLRLNEDSATLSSPGVLTPLAPSACERTMESTGPRKRNKVESVPFGPRDVSRLAAMGFDADECRSALAATDGNVQAAVERLLSGASSLQRESRRASSTQSSLSVTGTSLKPRVASRKSPNTLLSYFERRSD